MRKPIPSAPPEGVEQKKGKLKDKKDKKDKFVAIKNNMLLTHIKKRDK